MSSGIAGWISVEDEALLANCYEAVYFEGLGSAGLWRGLWTIDSDIYTIRQLPDDTED